MGSIQIEQTNNIAENLPMMNAQLMAPLPFLQHQVHLYDSTSQIYENFAKKYIWLGNYFTSLVDVFFIGNVVTRPGPHIFLWHKFANKRHSTKFPLLDYRVVSFKKGFCLLVLEVTLYDHIALVKDFNWWVQIFFTSKHVQNPDFFLLWVIIG